MIDLCLKPTFLQTVEHFIPLLAVSVLYKIISQCCKLREVIILFIILYFKKLFNSKFKILNYVNFLSAFIPNKMKHGASIIIGLLILRHYVSESLHLLSMFVVISHIYLYLPKKYRHGFGVFIPSIFIILYWYSFHNYTRRFFLLFIFLLLL